MTRPINALIRTCGAITLVISASMDFSLYGVVNGWFVEPVTATGYLIDNYGSYWQTVKDGGIVSEGQPWGISLNLFCPLILMIVAGLLVFGRSPGGWPGVVLSLLLVTFFVLPFSYMISTEWSPEAFGPWVYLASVAGLFSCWSESWFRRKPSNGLGS